MLDQDDNCLIKKGSEIVVNKRSKWVTYQKYIPPFLDVFGWNVADCVYVYLCSQIPAFYRSLRSEGAYNDQSPSVSIAGLEFSLNSLDASRAPFSNSKGSAQKVGAKQKLHV